MPQGCSDASTLERLINADTLDMKGVPVKNANIFALDIGSHSMKGDMTRHRWFLNVILELDTIDVLMSRH